MDKYIGRLLDNRYEILEIIGTGGMAVVYKARCHRLNRLVAIKILKDDYLQDEEFRRRFHAESQAVAMLGHPNIVAVYDVSTSIMADYIVMELIDGITLKQYMEKKGVLNWKETLHFAIQIAKALDHAHSRGIVHRDIKPHNIMVLKNGSVKVADFGIARMMSKGNTLTKEALGSVHYISPEQAKGGRVDSRSDIYSLGVVMYEMMSGRPPYDAESPVSVAIQHINGGAVMPSTLNPNIPGGLEQIIMKAMALNIDDRYTSAMEMLGDMDEFRKNPAMLFDYNVGPLDEMTKLPKPAPVRENPIPVTTAEKVVRRTTEGQRKPGGTPHSALKKPTAGKRDTAADRRRREEEARSNRIATIAIISCSVVMVIAIVISLLLLAGGGIFQKKQELVSVPQLIGKEYSSLGKYYGGFEISLGRSVYDDDYPEGVVILHEPAAGDEVAKGITIYVTVSKGPEPETKPAPVKMEKLVGLKQDAAEQVLRDYSVSVRVSFLEESSETVPVGCVTRTNPSEGQNVEDGQTVQLWISTGPQVKTGTMPNVIGDRKDTAAKKLTSQKLDLDIRYEEVFHRSVQEGFVVDSDPVAGVELSTGDTVTLFVSKGPQMEKMPNVVGMDIGTAVIVLKGAGFASPDIVLVYSQEPKDTVVSQSHEKNVEYDISTQISLEVSKGPEPTQPTTKPTEPTKPTRDVLINLQGLANEGECQVDVLLEGTVIYSETVEKGTASILLTGQSGTGKVVYIVRVKDLDGYAQFEHVEKFDDNE